MTSLAPLCQRATAIKNDHKTFELHILSFIGMVIPWSIYWECYSHILHWLRLILNLCSFQEDARQVVADSSCLRIAKSEASSVALMSFELFSASRIAVLCWMASDSCASIDLSLTAGFHRFSAAFSSKLAFFCSKLVCRRVCRGPRVCLDKQLLFTLLLLLLEEIGHRLKEIGHRESAYTM